MGAPLPFAGWLSRVSNKMLCGVRWFGETSPFWVRGLFRRPLLESRQMTEHTQTGHSPHIHRAAGRVAGRALRRNRVLNASWAAGSKVISSVGRVLHGLFLETMGLFFLLFALTGGVATYREYRAYDAGQIGVERVLLGVIFTALFTYFAVSSFRRAKRRQAIGEAR
jgi:hypothetical protein